MCKYPFRDFCVAYFISRSETNYILGMKKLSISFFNSLFFLEISTHQSGRKYISPTCGDKFALNNPAKEEKCFHHTLCDKPKKSFPRHL
jgi:hypothetical protein